MIITPPGPPPRSIEDLLGSDLAARLDGLDVVSRKIFAGKLPGERRSRSRGQSVEFDDFRPYAPGDDIRHIDWNLFARLDRFFLKLFLEDEDLAVRLVVDASPSMLAGAPSKLLTACRTAMALGYIGLASNDRVTVSSFGKPGRATLDRLTPIRGRSNARRLAAFLADVLGPGDATGGVLPFGQAMRQVASDRRAGNGVLAVLTDGLDPEGLERGLTYLGAAAHAPGGGLDVWLIQILSPGELDPAGETVLVGDLRLTDVETGRGREVTVTPATIKRYRERLERMIDRTAQACAARSITHVLMRSDADVGDLVLATLRQRGMVG